LGLPTDQKPVPLGKDEDLDRPQHVRQGYVKRFGTQFGALFIKNVIVSWRNLSATAARCIVAPLLFTFLVWVINQALTTGNEAFDPGRSIENPDVVAVQPIPDCTKSLFTRRPCLDFVYGPAGDPTVDALVESIRTNNPERIIPTSSVRGFPTREAANEYETANPESVLGGIFFSTLPSGSLGYVLQANMSTLNFHGEYQDPNLYIQVPLQVATERALAQLYYRREGRTLAAADWNVALSGFAHPPVDDFSLVGTLVSPFTFAAVMFSFVLVIAAVVAEREQRLRQALRTMGMLDSAFWLSWAAWELILSALTAVLLAAFGAMWQFRLYKENDFSLIFVLFLLFLMAMSSLAFLLSTFVSKSSTAVNLGFVIFIVGWIMQIIVIFGYPYTPDNISKYGIVTFLFSLAPWSMLSKAFNDLGLASQANNPGLRWGDRYDYCKDLNFQQQQEQVVVDGRYIDYDCVLPIGSTYVILVAQWIIYFILAIYLDNVLADENGVRRPLWYFLLPSYWGIGGRMNARHRPTATTTMGQQRLRPPASGKLACPHDGEVLDQDVAAEAAMVKELAAHRTGRAESLSSGEAGSMQQGLASSAVEIFGLQKVFRPSFKSKLAVLNPLRLLRRNRGPPPSDFWALRGPWFRIQRGSLFCLLGPNGAGKSTTINVLTGVLPPSGGDALVFGEALSAAGGMDRIRSRMGVCPQFDILWHELTGYEHVRLYGAIKGIPRRLVKQQAGELLGRVRLTEAAGVRAGAYSGGMRRRLSVAIALLGDPEVVYLDEPTTGMDPISRRFVWDIIEESKPGRAIVLTTHSMEEADILGDTIAIMARGQLRALGTSLRLKQRFGSGYQISVAVAAMKGVPSHGALAAAATNGAPVDSGAAPATGRTQRVKDFFKEWLGLEPSDETRAYVQWLVPRELEGRLPDFLAALESAAPSLSVTDVQISLTSLEEVFLSIAAKTEAAAAEAEGRPREVVHLQDGGQLEVHPGQETARDEASGQLYRLIWAQDADGALSVARWEPIESPPVVAQA